MRKVGLIVLFICFALGFSRAASAFPQFFNEFKAKYVKENGNADDKTFADLVNNKVKCGVCHGKDAQGKENKKVRNEYGKALSKLIGKNDKKDKAKIQQALETVAGQKSPSGATYGERLKEHKLPVE
ncbi:MAG: hypothetical protein ACREJM_10615 [Candidatus Saccharimonadales bacterium]